MPANPSRSATAAPARNGPVAFQRLCGDGAARLGILQTARGAVRTPAFAPVATRGALKGVTTADLPTDGFDLLLANTYHLLVRPGAETVAALGGIQKMLAWNGPVLTDSGGFQVFSLAGLRKLDREGVTFQNHLDGAPMRLTPASVVAAQEQIGSDIAMVLDVCPPLPAPNEEIRRAVDWTSRWAEQSLSARRKSEMALFAIVQGGLDIELRRRSARELTALDFDGYAIGGLSVGESAADMYRTLDATVSELPADQIRYLMGVGRPDNIVEAVARGVDMFDCVLPTRNARNGQLLTWSGILSIQRSEWAGSSEPLDARCACAACRTASRGLLRHLFKTGELNYFRLATVHNLTFMAQLMAEIRYAIAEARFDDLRQQILQAYAPGRTAR
jgi:queuine tRNA-ribosyltransferase